jgi:leader peptidase (prepilin peptidase)/N-methyltransferase
MYDINLYMAAFTGALIGLTLGSFAGMAGYRLARAQSWLGRSLCDACGMNLGAKDMVPVLTWAWRRGRCGCGQVGVSAAYPLMETLCAVACAAAGWRFGISPEFFLLSVLVMILAIIVAVDLEIQIIPDTANAALWLTGLGWTTIRQADYELQFAASGALFLLALFLATIYSKLRGRAVLGGGDVKFMAGAGMWLGLWSVSWFLVLTGIIGIIFGLLWKRKSQSPEFPFAPALAVALYATVILPPLM